MPISPQGISTSRKLTACSPLQMGWQVPGLWVGLGKGAGELTHKSIPQAMMCRSWRKPGTIPCFQCIALLYSLSEGAWLPPVVTTCYPSLTLLSCCYHNSPPSLGFWVSKSLPRGLILEKFKLEHSLSLSFFICHMRIIMPVLNSRRDIWVI